MRVFIPFRLMTRNRGKKIEEMKQQEEKGLRRTRQRLINLNNEID